MQTIDQPLVIAGYRGTHKSTETNRLVAGMTTTLFVRAVDADGNPAPPVGLDNVASWKFVMAADWNPATAPCYATSNVDYDAENGIWTVHIFGSRTAAMIDALRNESMIEIGCEIVGLDESGDWAHPAFVLQWTGEIRNRRDSEGTPPADATGTTQVATLRVTGQVFGGDPDGTAALDPSARYLLGNWFSRFGTFEAEAIKTQSLKLYDAGAGGWRSLSIYNGQLVVGNVENNNA